ncbi:glycosyl transferase [Candidatus Izimaplasma bacterium ZiA1]|uniref:glycosyltransferase family 2 protein n=1 Tax=Candidatus Izimoplasma sp. ZiA1 TaxID=2024899 RepID=UPI000BAA5406|nr:glycosyl transferase [Candidatus Izimaplasma bacterium ZiA1]
MYGKVSIITPCYNSKEFLNETISSVISQSYKNWELIIVDDKSTDDSRSIILDNAKKDSRIKYIFLSLNSGAAVARNKGIEIASGKFIAFLDSDDLWHKEKLTRQLNFMSSYNYMFSCTSYSQINEKGVENNKVIRAIERANYRRVLLDCPIGNSTVIYNVEVLGKFFVPNIRKRNDDALWLKMLKSTDYIYGLDKTLMYYRLRQNSISSNKMDLIKYHWKLYREIEELSFLTSVYHIIVWIVIKVLRLK